MNILDPTNEVVTTLRQIIRVIDLQSKKLVKNFGITGPQLIVLNEIKKTPGQQISKLSKRISLSQATVTSILNRLEQQGLAIRVRSNMDKRQVHISITEKAEEILKNKPSLLQESFSKKFNKLEDWEQNMILASLQRLSTMMDAERIESPPVLVSGPIEASPSEVDTYLREKK